MLLARVVEISRRVAGTSRRLAKIELLAGLLRQLSPEEVEVVAAYLSGGTRQSKLGIGYAALRDASATPAPEPSLEVLEADRMLAAVASTTGRGSQELRKHSLHAMFVRATAVEQQFLSGLLLGELRQGALAGLMVDAVAKAFGIPIERVRRAAMMAGDLPLVARAAMEKGEAGLAAYDVQLFRPVQPMLAQTAEDVSAALAELGEAALEYKFDGARIQVHRSGGDVRVYSRRLNEVTAAVPEIVEAVRALPAQELILDGEVVALDAAGRPHPFQVTMRRFGRRLDVARMRAELPLTPFWFDIIYRGQPLLDEPQKRRFEELAGVVPAPTLVPHRFTSDAGDAELFFQRALASGHEGIMAKSAEAPYQAGARGQSWLKLKQAHTLDLVVLAAEWGSGRRKGFLSNLHLGARDPEKGGFAMLGKTFKGLTDEMLAWQTRKFLELEIARDNYTVHLRPELVVEIAFNDVQISPHYASGVALRFARVKRYRTDKSAADADTYATVRRLARLE